MKFSISAAHKAMSNLLALRDADDIRAELVDIWSYGMAGTSFVQDPLGTHDHEKFVFDMYGIKHVEDLDELGDKKIKELWNALIYERVHLD